MGCTTIKQSNIIKIQRYNITKRLKSDTYLITEKKSNITKILKCVQTQPKLISKWIEEYNKLFELKHPNLITIERCFFNQLDQFAYNQTQNKICIVMEYFDGINLNNLTKQFTSQQIINIYQQIKSALLYIHQKKRIHSCITLQNILIDKMNTIKLSSLILPEDLQIRKLQSINIHLAPPEYRQSKLICKQFDYWQLGILLIQLIANPQKTKDINNINQINFLNQILKKNNVSNQLKQIIQSLMKQDHKQRIFKVQPSCENQVNLMIESNSPDHKNQIEKDNMKIEDIETKSSKVIQNESIKNNFSKFIIDLKELNLCNSLLNDESSLIIKQNYKLVTKIHVNGNNISDKFIVEIKEMLPRVTELSMAFTNITDMSLLIIKQTMINCQKLDLSYTRITSKGIMSLRKLNKLKCLHIWSGHDYFPQAYYDYISKYTQYSYQAYKHNCIKVNAWCLRTLQNFKLKQIVVNARVLKIDKFIRSIDNEATRVEVIGDMNHETVNRILKLQQLQYLYLKQIKTQVTFVELKSTALKDVSLVNCKFALKQLIYILEKCQNLNSLNLSENRIDDYGVDSIITLLKKLKSINLSRNNITDSGAISICKNANINKLILQWNSITESGLSYIVSHLKNLRVLNLKNNKIKQNMSNSLINNMNLVLQI